MTETGLCAQCNAPIRGRGVQGLCPACLARMAFALDEIPADEAAGGPGVSPVRAETHRRDARATTASRSKLRYFGDYELIEEIARGGGGVVYRARQLSLNRVVAVKMLPFSRQAEPEFIRRFKAEAEAAANLQHPNIVAIHEVGEHEGQHYFSMDYVEGQNLAQRVQNQPLSPELATTYLRPIAEAVHYAHQRGVLHRDLKPSNILIDPFDQPRITDFGLAKRLDSESDLTATGQIMGTPQYMSPEQARGRSGEVTIASDLYSLGAILYFLLTGRPPFQAETMEGVLHQLLHDEPAPPRQLNPAVPRDLETICLKCLSKEPQGRYVTAREVAEELSRFHRGEPITARPLSPPEKIWRWCRRRPVIAGLVVALHLVLALGLAGILWQWQRAEANLYRSYLSQARTLRASSQAGRRAEALKLLAAAANTKASLELRNEAIANLAQTDIASTNAHPSVERFADNETFDAGFSLAAIQYSREKITLENAFSRQPLGEVQPPRSIPGAFRTFSLDSRFLAFDTAALETCVWDTAQEKIILSVPAESSLGDFSPDSHYFAITTTNGIVSFFALPSGQLARRVGNGVPVSGLRFDPTGTRFACWDAQRLEIRDAASGERLVSFGTPGTTADPAEGLYRRAVWSGDGKLLAACGPDRQIYVWVAETGRLIQTLLGPSGPMVSLAMSGSGELIAASSFDDTTLLCEVATGRRLAVLPGMVRNVAFSQDERFLGPGRLGPTSNCVYEIIRPSSFRRLAPPIPETSVKRVHAMGFSPDGRLAAAAGAEGVMLWDCFSRRFLCQLPTPEACAVEFDADGSSLFISANDELTRWPLRYETQPGRQILSIGPRQDIGLAGKFCGFLSADRSGELLAVASRRSPAVILNLRQPSSFVALEQVHTNGSNISLSPDGRFVATGTWHGRNVRISDARTGKLLHEHPTPSSALVLFSPDNHWLMIAGDEYHALRVGQWTNWQVVPRSGDEHPPGPMAFSPDGRLWAKAKSSTSYELIEPGTWRSVAILQSPYPLALGRARFSPDGMLFAAPDGALGVQIWDLRALRGELQSLGLDWDHPAYPPAAVTTNAKPLVVEVLTK